jgi:hypothetical protein
MELMVTMCSSVPDVDGVSCLDARALESRLTNGNKKNYEYNFLEVLLT